MAKQYNIRWRERDRDELQRIINNFNAKLYRVKKKNPDLADIYPERMNMTKAVESIQTRADYERLVKSLQRFSERGAEEVQTSTRGAKATKWEIDEFNRAQKIDNRRKQKERKLIEGKEVLISGKGTGQKRAAMGSIRINEMKESNHNFESKSQKEWDLAKKYFEDRIKANYTEAARKYMQANYMRGLYNAGFSEELINYIATIPTDKFFEIVSLDETASFDFIYAPEELAVKTEELWTTWEEYGTGKNQLGITIENLEAFNVYLDQQNILYKGAKSESVRQLFFKYFNLL